MEPGYTIRCGWRGRTGQWNPTKPSAKQKQKQKTAIPSHIDGEQSPRIPQWFLENCVKAAEELAISKVPLIVREDVFVELEKRQETDGSTSDTYEVASVVYEPLLGILTNATHIRKSDVKGKKFFVNDAVHLRFPDKGRTKGGIEFLTAVVERFAKDIRADLITLRAEDFIDLVEHFTSLIPKEGAEDRYDPYYGDYDSKGDPTLSDDVKDKAIEDAQVSLFSVQIESPPNSW